MTDTLAKLEEESREVLESIRGILVKPETKTTASAKIAAFVSDKIHDAVLEERERNCKALCEFCADPTHYAAAQLHSFSIVDSDVWVHPIIDGGASGEEDADYRMCSAASIRQRGKE